MALSRDCDLRDAFDSQDVLRGGKFRRKFSLEDEHRAHALFETQDHLLRFNHCDCESLTGPRFGEKGPSATFVLLLEWWRTIAMVFGEEVGKGYA